eukprot:gene8297-10177_t
MENIELKSPQQPLLDGRQEDLGNIYDEPGDYIEIQLDRRKPRRTPPIDTTDIDDPDAQLLALDDHGPADEDDLVKPKMSSWPATSATIVANSLPQAVAQMGWAVSVIVLSVMTLISTYSSVVLAWLRGSAVDITTYPALAGYITRDLGKGTALFHTRLTQVLLYTFLQGVCTIYLITMKLAIEEIFQTCQDETNSATPSTNSPFPDDSRQRTCDVSSCTVDGVTNLPDTIWLGIAAACVFPFVHFRRLAHATWLSVLGVVTILIINAVIIYRCIQHLIDGTHEVDSAQKYHRTFRDLINGISTVVFAYGGHGVMLDILSEMKEPAKFSRAVYSSQGFMFFNYAIV